VIASATAGSTSRIFLYSSATGSSASATPDDDGPDRDVGLVVAVGGGEQALADVGLALVVLLDDDDLLAGDGHRPAGGVVEAHHEAGLRLLAVRLERAGLAVDVGDADLALALRQRQRRGERGERGDGEQRTAAAAESDVGDEGHGEAP
jgi:hypothetical protein